MADPLLLKQVLFNLAKNAVEAAPANRVQVSLTTGMKADGTPYLLFADDGPGIAAEVRRRLFQPYSSSKGPDQGMGLGLAIAKKVMQDHGGDIVLLATPHGAAFEMSFSK
jgi:two-component system C4-dicarboxylate transport sensor histidine kinase DctB